MGLLATNEKARRVAVRNESSAFSTGVAHQNSDEQVLTRIDSTATCR